MALNFPSNPAENDIYQFGLLTYVFKNGKWVSQSRGASQLPWYSNMEQARALWKRLAAEAGLNLVDGSFEEGAEITSSSDVVWWQAGSAIYGWHLNEAKTVPPGSTPATSGGIGVGAWVDRTDVTLRSELGSDSGAGLVSIKQEGAPEKRSVSEMLGTERVVNAADFGLSVTASAQANTIALCKALDAANGDYLALKQLRINTKKLVCQSGVFNTDPAYLTGIHASYGMFVIRCDVDLQGRFPDADFAVVHAKSLHIDKISAKNVKFHGIQHLKVGCITAIQDISFFASEINQPAGFSAWGGGSFWNEFNVLKAGSTQSAGGIILDVVNGSINQNKFGSVSGKLMIRDSNIANTAILKDCHGNKFDVIDTTGSSSHPITNSTAKNQRNTILSWYDEITSDGKVVGNFDILFPHNSFGNWASQIDYMNSVQFNDHKTNQASGDFLSQGSSNLAVGGNFSVIKGANGFPQCVANNSEFTVSSDASNPTGAGLLLNRTTTTGTSFLTINLTQSKTGYVRYSMFLKGAPTGISIRNSDDTNIFFQDVSKYFDCGDGWFLYKGAAKVDSTKACNITISANAGVFFGFGGIHATQYNACINPQFPGWQEVIGVATTTPVFQLVPNGFWFKRDSGPTSTTDPVVAWVKKADGTTYGEVRIA